MEWWVIESWSGCEENPSSEASEGYRAAVLRAGTPVVCAASLSAPLTTRLDPRLPRSCAASWHRRSRCVRRAVPPPECVCVARRRGAAETCSRRSRRFAVSVVPKLGAGRHVLARFHPVWRHSKSNPNRSWPRSAAGLVLSAACDGLVTATSTVVI